MPGQRLRAHDDSRAKAAALVQIESKGFEAGTPFSLNAEARQSGGC
jgi:hypothetical protein